MSWAAMFAYTPAARSSHSAPQPLGSFSSWRTIGRPKRRCRRRTNRHPGDSIQIHNDNCSREPSCGVAYRGQNTNFCAGSS